MTGFPNSGSFCWRGLMDLVDCVWLNADACLARGGRRGSSTKDEFRLEWLKATSITGADVSKLTALHLLLPTQRIFLLTATPSHPLPNDKGCCCLSRSGTNLKLNAFRIGGFQTKIEKYHAERVMNYSLKLATRYERTLTNDSEANFDVEMRIFPKKCSSKIQFAE